MSSEYWMGYHCDGLYLTSDEAYELFDRLKEAGLLKKVTGAHGENEVDLDPEDLENECFDLVAEANNGGINAYGANGKAFWPINVDADRSDGARFIPYEEGIEGFSRENVIIVCLDNQPEWYRTAYNTIEEMVREMQEKFAKYLPADFPWKERLGHFQYAFYA